MEGAHGELRAGLTDGLGGNDADRLTDVDHVPASQVAAVAQHADASPGLAGQHRPNLDLGDAGILHDANLLLGDLLVGLHQHLAGVRIEDVVDRHTAENTIAQLLDDLAALFERSNLDALERAAVILGDDAVLRHVDEATREVT